jgi:large subunit ribosomal protein L28
LAWKPTRGIFQGSTVGRQRHRLIFPLRRPHVGFSRSFTVPRKCDLTDKTSKAARNVSHAHNVTPRWQHPNLQSKRIYVPELKRFVRLRVSTRALRTITKKGLMAFLRDEGKTLDQVT